MNAEQILGLFIEQKCEDYTIKNTSRGDDFREVIIARWKKGVLPEHFNDRFVVKAAQNGFTDPGRIAMWKRCAEEYTKLGYYCPRIVPALSGKFEVVDYNGRQCVVYGEEYSKYRSADEIGAANVSRDGYFTYIDDAILMNAKVAAQYFDYTRLPSAYCMFEKFDPTDKDDEVMENALAWKALADKLPAQFARQTQRIWKRWLQNRERLEKIYPLLPRSVFQADINHTNCLLDEDRNFRGVYDFNIAGSEVFINYLIREIPYVMTTDAFDASKVDDYALKSILHAIEVSKKVYRFNDLEKRAAIMIYRCVKPIWFTEVENLRRAGGDSAAIAQCLDKTEFIQTRDIDFDGYMS